MDWKKVLFDFHGRLNRAKYWLAGLIYFIVAVALALLGFIVGGGVVFRVVSGTVDFVVFVSSIAVGVKRLHDRDKSALWLAFYYLGPFGIAAAAFGLGYSAQIFSGDLSMVLLFRLGILAAFAVGICGFVEMGFLRGSTGYNSYGPNPLAKK